MKDNELTFEKSVSRLEEIVKQLDDTGTGLDSALECYEEGVRLLKHCNNILDTAQRRIEILRSVDENGSPVIEAADENQFKTAGF
ncbi:MAG: exodeoxyribonuclease VII small subunit [Planctomycetaceae bacterium]|nr:exodeoxyribonuclease VII small subunit [Planctomycetaceae bacterium]